MATSDAPLNVPNVTLAVARGASAPSFTLLVDKGFESGGITGSAQSEFSSGASRAVYANTLSAYEGAQYIDTTAIANNDNTFGFGGFLEITPSLVLGDEVWIRQAIYAREPFWEDSNPALKFMRLKENDAGGNNAGYADIYIKNSPSTDPDPGIYFIKEGSIEPSARTAYGAGITPDINAWTTYEMYLKLGTTDTTGHVRVWRNNTLIIDSGVITMNNSGGYCPMFLLFTYWNNATAGQTGPTVDHTVGVDLIQIATSASPPTARDAANNPFIGESKRST